MLTTEDQKTYYALIKHWEDRGRTDKQVPFSIRGLAKGLKKKWGTNVIHSVTESLIRLRTIPFLWRNSYYDSTTGETIKILDTFNILSELKIVQREQDGVVNREVGYFKFNDFTLNNLLANHTKPLLLETVLGFRSEIALLLYTYLDLIIADKTSYERRTKELFEDLGLRGKAYRNLSDRKRVLENALKELRGAPLTTGRISAAYLAETKDGKDYKVVFRKGRTQATLPTTNPAPAESRGEESSPPPQPEKDHITLQGAELVKHFHKLFHGSERSVISSKAIGQAVSLIAQVGFDQAKFIVDYSHKVAPETDYHPQTFGGILQYTARALAAFEQHQHDQARAAAQAEARRQEMERELEQQRQAQVEREQDTARLDALPEDQRLALHHQATEQVLKKYSWLANANQSGAMFQSILCAEMIDLLNAQEQNQEQGTEPPASSPSETTS